MERIENFDELDEALNQLEKPAVSSSSFLEEKKQDDSLTVKFNDKTNVEVNSDDEMLTAIFNSALDDKNKADSLFKLMQTRIEFEKDRSDSTKEALSASLTSRIEATSNLIKLYELRRKYDAKLNANGNSLISFNLNKKESGIDINNIVGEVLNEGN